MYFIFEAYMFRTSSWLNLNWKPEAIAAYDENLIFVC